MHMKYLQTDPVKNISKRLLASMSHWKPSAKSTSALTASTPEQSYKHIGARIHMPQSLGKAGLYSHRWCLQQQLNMNWGVECPKRKLERERMSLGLCLLPGRPHMPLETVQAGTRSRGFLRWLFHYPLFSSLWSTLPATGQRNKGGHISRDTDIEGDALPAGLASPN